MSKLLASAELILVISKFFILFWPGVRSGGLLCNNSSCALLCNGLCWGSQVVQRRGCGAQTNTAFQQLERGTPGGVMEDEDGFKDSPASDGHDDGNPKKMLAVHFPSLSRTVSPPEG